MDGLECSEIAYSYVMNQSDIFRLDSFYFLKEFIRGENILNQQPTIRLKNVSGASILSFGAYSLNNFVEYLDSGVPFIRCVDMKDGLIDTNTLTHISEAAHKLLYKSEVFPETILVSMSGSIGKVALASPNWKYPINSNQDIAKIRLGGNLNPYYAYTFFQTKYGQNFMRREARGSVQQHVFLSQIEQIAVPLFSTKFYERIEKLNRTAFSFVEQSRRLFTDTEDILLSELNFNLDKMSTESISEKSFSESFAVSGRLDAEYYLPKYDDLFALLDRLPTKRLGEIVDIRKSIEPGSEYYGDEGVPFIRVSDVTKTGIDAPSIKIPLTTVPSIEKLYPKKDTILFSKDGSVGIAYKMEDDVEAVTSGALLHLRVKNTTEVLPDYLTLVLNSEAVQLQAERDTNGAIIQHWKPGDIANVIVPILPYEVQSEIARKVRDSFSLRRQSEKLIETAVRAVEIAIERDEAAAVEWLKSVADF